MTDMIAHGWAMHDFAGHAFDLVSAVRSEILDSGVISVIAGALAARHVAAESRKSSEDSRKTKAQVSPPSP